MGYASLAKCAVPESSFLRDLSAPLVQPWISSTRGVDQVPLGVDEPQEEEWIMASRSPISFNHCFFFPQAIERVLAGILDPSPAEVRSWCHLYREMVKELTRESGGRRLVLKSPAHLARIPMLLRLFPEARFIHIYRNPYVVYESTVHLWKTLLSWWAFQAYDMEMIRNQVLKLYPLLLNRFFEESTLIPPENLIEVRFEKLDEDPVTVLREINGQLGLGSFSEVRPELDRYLTLQSGYRKNKYSFSKDSLEEVYRHWHPIIDGWSYSPPIPAGISA